MKRRTSPTWKLSLAIAATCALALAAGALGCSRPEQPVDTTEMAEEQSISTPATANPLTGEHEYSSKAIGKRPVAVVVENNSSARPQWNMDSPDIILEGEIENSEDNNGTDSRMLWFYADYRSLPDKVGPMRSARPSFVKFSELFDAVFIHWGESHSKGDYVGATTVFKKDEVDHVNQMEFAGDAGKYFGRDGSRDVPSWHTAYLKGDTVPDMLKLYKFRTDIDEGSFTRLIFAPQPQALSTRACSKVKVRLSKRLNHKTTWTYSEKDRMFHSKDYEQDVAVENVVVLFDKTAYVEKEGYRGAGDMAAPKTEVYCNYKLGGGKGYIASDGTARKIRWNRKGGTLNLLDADGKPVVLNPGRSWIGWASSNHGGKVKVVEPEPKSGADAASGQQEQDG